MLAQLNSVYIKLSLFKTYQRLLAYFLFEGRPLTTKGRWVNPIIKGWLWLLSFVCKGKPRHPPVFIIGTGRSGTTLLGMLLSMHRDIAFLNEPKIIWHVANKKDDVIGSYSIKTPGTFLLNVNDCNKKVIGKMNAIYKVFSKLSNASVIVDKYPEMIFRTDYVEKIFPGARFIFITRNLQDTVNSTVLWNKMKGIPDISCPINWWGLNDRKWKLICRELVPQSKLLKQHIEEINLFTDDTLKSATEWVLTIEKGIELMSKKKNVLHIKYEELADINKHTLTTILNFLNLEADAKVEEYASKILVKSKIGKNDISLPHFLELTATQLLKKLNYE